MFDDLDPRSRPPPRHPVTRARLSAMAVVILRAAYSREADREWEAELLKAARGLARADKRRLQRVLDAMVDGINEGADGDASPEP